MEMLSNFPKVTQLINDRPGFEPWSLAPETLDFTDTSLYCKMRNVAGVT